MGTLSLLRCADLVQVGCCRWNGTCGVFMGEGLTYWQICLHPLASHGM